jgi:hypothetical protein
MNCGAAEATRWHGHGDDAPLDCVHSQEEVACATSWWTREGAMSDRRDTSRVSGPIHGNEESPHGVESWMARPPPDVGCHQRPPPCSYRSNSGEIRRSAIVAQSAAIACEAASGIILWQSPAARTRMMRIVTLVRTEDAAAFAPASRTPGAPDRHAACSRNVIVEPLLGGIPNHSSRAIPAGLAMAPHPGCARSLPCVRISRRRWR